VASYISLEDPEAFKKKVHQSLRAWLKQDSSPEELLDGLFLVQLERRQVILQHNMAMLRMATNAVLERAIDRLRLQDEEGAAVLFARFANNETRQEVANRIHVSEFTVSRIQSRAIDGVTAVLIAQEMAERETHS
jgi:DNA-directed RNA polymerase specialized sigma subunit